METTFDLNSVLPFLKEFVATVGDNAQVAIEASKIVRTQIITNFAAANPNSTEIVTALSQSLCDTPQTVTSRGRAAKAQPTSTVASDIKKLINKLNSTKDGVTKVTIEDAGIGLAPFKAKNVNAAYKLPWIVALRTEAAKLGYSEEELMSEPKYADEIKYLNESGGLRGLLLDTISKNKLEKLCVIGYTLNQLIGVDKIGTHVLQKDYIKCCRELFKLLGVLPDSDLRTSYLIRNDEALSLIAAEAFDDSLESFKTIIELCGVPDEELKTYEPYGELFKKVNWAKYEFPEIEESKKIINGEVTSNFINKWTDFCNFSLSPQLKEMLTERLGELAAKDLAHDPEKSNLRANLSVPSDAAKAIITETYREFAKPHIEAVVGTVDITQLNWSHCKECCDYHTLIRNAKLDHKKANA